VADRSGRKRLLFLLLRLAMGIVVVAVLVTAARCARRAARRAVRTSHLRQIGLGLFTFHQSYGRLPPAVRVDKAGRRLCSWRFQILPFLEGIMTSTDFGSRWDAPANRWLANHPWPVYCWSQNRGSPDNLYTNVLAITGAGTAFDGDRESRLDEMDGDTILLIEGAASGVHWMEPGDLHIDEVPESIVCGLDGDGIHVLFADRQVWFLRADVPLADLKKFFTIARAKQYDRERVLRPYVVVTSQ